MARSSWREVHSAAAAAAPHAVERTEKAAIDKILTE